MRDYFQFGQAFRWGPKDVEHLTWYERKELLEIYEEANKKKDK